MGSIALKFCPNSHIAWVFSRLRCFLLGPRAGPVPFSFAYHGYHTTRDPDGARLFTGRALRSRTGTNRAMS
eukprot:4492477-Prymnesium_polylepis.1